jgi:hypothetical protein
MLGMTIFSINLELSQANVLNYFHSFILIIAKSIH